MSGPNRPGPGHIRTYPAVPCTTRGTRTPAGIKITDAQMPLINLERHAFHGDWNYTILPQ